MRYQLDFTSPFATVSLRSDYGDVFPFAEAYLGPFFPVATSPPVNCWTVALVVATPAEIQCMRPMPNVVVQADEDTSGPPSAIIVDPSSFTVWVFVSRHRETGYVVARVVRDLLTSRALACGWVLRHAAAFHHAGVAVVVAGHKGAGKTSLLLGALLLGADYIANDRLLIDPNGRWCHGLPHSPAVSAEAIDSFPRLSSQSGYYWQNPDSGKRRFLASEITQRFDASVVPSAEIGIIALPRFQPGCERIVTTIRSIEDFATFGLDEISEHLGLWDTLLEPRRKATALPRVRVVEIRFGPGTIENAARHLLSQVDIH